MGHNGCDGSQASGPWAIGSGYRFNITWPDQVAPRGRKASSTRKIKPKTSNLCRHLGMQPRVG